MPHLVEIVLPLTKTLTREKLDTIRAELTDRFGGVTLHSNASAEDLWRDDGDLERDRIVVVEIMTDTLERPGGRNSVNGWKTSSSRMRSSYARRR